MNKTSETYVLPGWLRSWEQFWFTPADPSLLGLIRIACGVIVVYTLFAYSFSLQDMMGQGAWNDLPARMEIVRERPVHIAPFVSGVLPEPRTEFETRYLREYKARFRVDPPPPYPENEEQAEYVYKFIKKHRIDPRIGGLRPPRTDEEYKYLDRYATKHKHIPPAYVKNEAEENTIDEYIRLHGHDPRRSEIKGTRIFSLWFHVLDPETMAVIHVLIVVCAFLFTIGFCTRLTTALTWFGSLSYTHRNPTMVFGVDTMMTIVLLYLMIGPGGAAYSVDNLIGRWWASAKPGIVQAWYRLWRRPIPSLEAIAPAAVPAVVPSVGANVAIRMLQIHVGIVYLAAGLSKLLGNAWWTGEAIWGTLGNFEFAPMQFDAYLWFLSVLGQHKWLYHLVMTGSGLFTLAFEISYIFLVWRPRLRWVFLAAAVLLHGGIGLFMGLKTFSLMMLVMNMAFLSTPEVHWVMRWFGAGPAPPATAPAPGLQPAAVVASTAIKK